jgi:hypothetical protein
MTDLTLPTDKDIENYTHYRRIGIEVNQELVNKLPKKALEECGKKLGILKGKTFYLDENDSGIFIDYCLHHFRINKANVIDRELAITSLDKDSIEFDILESMAMAYYSVFFVKQVFEGKGILVVDLLYQDELFVIDVGMAQTGMENFIFSGHLVPFKDFYITSGAPLPIPIELLQNDTIPSILSKFIDEDSDDYLSNAKETSFATQIIRSVLRYDGDRAEMIYNEL